MSIVTDLRDLFSVRPPEPTAVTDASLDVFSTIPGNLDWKDRTTQYREGYLINPYVRQACELYAVRLSSIDHVVYNEAGDDITDSDAPFVKLMENPNKDMSRTDMLARIGTYLGIYGEAFIYPHRTAQGYDALYLIDPTMMTETLNSMDLVNPVASWKCSKFIDGQSVFLPEEIIHIKFADPDMSTVRGLSRMASCGRSVEMMNAIKEWNINTTNNGAKPSIAINIPQRLTSEQRGELKSDLRQGYQGRSNAGNGMILDDGKTVTMMGMTAVEMDYQTGLVNAAKEISIAYGIPPEMMGDSANKTYSNAQEAGRQIVVNTIKPLLNLVYSAIWGFFRDKPIATGIGDYTYDVEQLSDFMGVQTDLYTALQSATYLTANDKRKKLGYDPIEDPLADQLMLTMADVPMSEYSMDDLDPGRKDPDQDDLKVLFGESP